MNEQLQASVAVILDQQTQTQLLLTRREQPEKLEKHNKWHLPGGAVEHAEEPDQALRRELIEELNLTSFSIDGYATLARPNSDFNQRITLFHIFLILVDPSTVINIADDPDANAVKWFELSSVHNLQTFPLVSVALKLFNK